MASLNDRSVLVVGATGGLGSLVSRRLAAEGARLTLMARDAERVRALGLDGAVVTGDLRDGSTAARAVTAAVDAHGGLDGLVIASGVVAFSPVADLPDQALVDLFLINALAPMRLISSATPHLAASAAAGRAPFVLSLSAIVAEHPTAGMAAYSASKAALTAYDVAAARELRRLGVRLVDARPPHTETGLADRPLTGTAPRLPQGLEPDAVAERLVRAILDDESDLASSAFA